MAQDQPQPWCHMRDARALLRRIRDDDSSLTEVDLGGKGLGDDGVRELATALDHNRNIHRLHLYGNDISDDGVAALTGVLRANSTLTHLDLQHNGIQDGGAEALAQMLRCNSAIEYLELVGNSIEDGGARALAVALVRNHTLEELYVNGNSINDGGAEALAWAVCLNPSLTNLWLGNNYIGERGARALNTAAHNLGGEGVGREDLTAYAEGLFAETAPIQMGPKELGAIKQHLAAGAGTKKLCLDSGLEGVPIWVKRAGQKKLLEAVYAAGMKKVVDASIPMKAESAPLILEKVGETIGVRGVFGIMIEQHEIFMPEAAPNMKVSGNRKHKHLE